MRILLCTLPQRTHFLTMVPLAWALRTAGHEVRVASLPGFSDSITQAGLTAAPVGRNVDVDRLDSREEREDIRRGLPKPYDMAGRQERESWAQIKPHYDGFVKWGHQLHNFPLLGDLMRMARQWKPDLVLWEPLTYAGPLAAKACGATHARLMFTMDVYGVTHERIRSINRELPPERREDALVNWLTSYGEKYGVEFSEDMVSGHFTIDQLPESLRLEADLHYVPMQYIPYGGPAVVPKWLWEKPTRPRVALTLGLSATEHFNGYTFNIKDALESLSDLDIEVVATIAADEQAKLGQVPDNVRLVDYVPLDVLAPTCAAVINHGGFGTVSTTARHGVPQLLLPYHFEGPLLAEKIAAQGAGLVIHSDQATGQTIRASLLRLLNEATFRARAAALRAEIALLPTPNALVEQLEELTVRYRPTVA